MSTTNFIIYMREDLKPEVRAKIEGWNLSDVIKQLNIPEGKVTAYGKDTATITGTSNAVGASIKMTMGQWCVVESYVEVHPRITANLGPVARGS
jgi:hypothetical protein